MKTPIVIDRPPRIQPELPFDEIDIPPPPEKEKAGWERLLQVALPLLTIVGYILIAALGGRGRSPLLMIPMALSVVGSTAFSIYSFLKERERRAEVERAYNERLVELNKEMHEHHDQQRRFYSYNFPERAQLLRIVRNARRKPQDPAHPLRTEARLYERRVEDDDFGVIRLGMGTLPSTVVYLLRDAENYEDRQVRAALKLQEDSQYVTDIPVILNLRRAGKDALAGEDQEEDGRTPVSHAVGIAGEQQSVYEFTRSVLAHYTVFHAPMDAQLYVLAARRREWEWTEQLPHCQGDEQSQHVCFVEDHPDTGEEDVFHDQSAGGVSEFLEGLRKELAQRKIRLADNNENEGKSDPRLPFLLLVVDLLDQEETLSALESDAAISILLEEGSELGAAVLFLVPERSKIPSGCRSVIEIERTTPASNSRSRQFLRMHFRYAEVGVNSYRYVGEADYISNPEHMQALANELANMEVVQGYGANLAGALLYLDLMRTNSLDALMAQSDEWWRQSTQPDTSDWLRVKLARMSGNKDRTLVFSAKRDGVHGMVAGSTGSGKSELLISLITSMAVTYHPSVLNFVLVDYKGGGAFEEFRSLPHCVDIITNLKGEGVTRMFTAVKAELQRRQMLLARAKNIVAYRRQGLHLREPLPFLFIIIDEFAEMIADRSEYKAELESITRVGRSLGVSLILAAQRPSGVTDQMRSNIKFRICLRVETPGESREMLRQGDAAYLPSIPGRGYLQVGNDSIELIQVAYTGEKYVDPNQAPLPPVIWPDRQSGSDVEQDLEPPALYQVLIRRLAQQARQQMAPPQRAPWPDFLPDTLSLTEPLIAQDNSLHTVTSAEYLTGIEQITLGRPADPILALNPFIERWLNGGVGWVEPLDWSDHALAPVVGLVDNPLAASQLPLTVNFRRGHVVLFGASGWGKTTFIRSLVVSLAASHSPNHVHIYVLDLGGHNLNELEALPHVGSVIIPDEEGYVERVEQLLRVLNETVEARKTIFSTAGVGDIYQYNRQHPTQALSAIVVAIDNFVEFRETFGANADNEESVLDRFVALARQAKAYGIHFVITATQLGDLSNQLMSIFTERMTLKLADSADYRAVVGGHVEDVEDTPGRGYVKLDRAPLAFQIALPFQQGAEGEELAHETSEFRLLAQNMNEYVAQHEGHYRLPEAINALREAVLYKKILADEANLSLDDSLLDQLKAYTRRQWARSVDPQDDHSDWLSVMLGVKSGDRPLALKLEAKAAGVHGMIAGGTGSGKSELLMTMIVDMALNYDPSMLNFVLVDYKGGGAFAPFEKLPHVVDIVTNLNRAAVRRMFTAIDAEMQRRQLLNKETDTKHIVEYRKANLHRTHAPYPHLFIIIDEYAEMITDAPEFRDELDSITRLGRAQGVHLLLASQRPVGVSDQMRANIKYRLCLRVEQVDTSREMLRRSDAAFLPSGMPGRGYLQIGNENIELVQVAYTGETYSDVEAARRLPTLAEKNDPKFYDVVVGLTNELLDGAPPLAPWPPFLPQALTFSRELEPAYLHEGDRELLSLYRNGHSHGVVDQAAAQPTSLSLNPQVQAWLNDAGAWTGVDWKNHAMRAVVGLLDDPYSALRRPLVVDLTRGHGVVFGSSGWGKSTFLRSLILSLASTHSPGEFHAHILDLGGRNLEVLKELPHVGTVIMPDAEGYEERVQQLLRELNQIVADRKKLFTEQDVTTLVEYNSQPDRTPLPAILVVVDNFLEFIESFGNVNAPDERDSILGAFVALVRQGNSFGLHFVISADQLKVLSSKLYSLFTERFSLRLSDPSDYSAIVGGRIVEIEEVRGRGYTRVGRRPLSFQVALPPGAADDTTGRYLGGETAIMRTLGRKMAAHADSLDVAYPKPLRIDALQTASIYRKVLADAYDLSLSDDFLAQLSEAVRLTWAHNRSAEAADWLKVILGVTSGNRTRTLALEAKKDGVHGMIAGGTGSGKSELLMTLIVGLALRYPPDILNFVLVDYKGGGAFKPFERLPHVVDMVTNLNTAAVDRMFTAITAEIRRRQALNVATNTKDIVDYRQRGLHLNGGTPYPHLFVIIDEYAEMIDDNPDYRSELESITRVGRAQGINLLLASQRPKGVTDQMRANIKFRICLRVEEMDTSREMLRRPDAALLPSGMPGRGYLQVGNENIELIQVSWTGDKQRDERPAPVLWPDRKTESTIDIDVDPPTFFEAAVSLSSALYGGGMAPKPWPGFLPKYFSLQSPLEDGKAQTSFVLEPAVTDWLNGDSLDHLWPGVDWESAMQPVVGLLDEPAEARQSPLSFDLSRNHLVVLGDSGFGKTTMLRTLITSLAVTHSPDELHVYVLDLGGRNFRSIEAWPHVGAVIYADEEAFEERLQRLMEMLNHMRAERAQLFSEAGVTNFYAYNTQNPQAALPAVLVVIDNFAELQENYEMLVESTILPLVRSSTSMGIAFVASANVPNNMSSKLFSLFGERITFKQNNPDRYMDIVGRGAIDFDDVPGRGYTRQGKQPLLFHTALPVGLLDVEGRDARPEAEEMRLLGERMQAQVDAGATRRQHQPNPIKILPEIVPLRAMLDAVGEPHRQRVRAVIGQNAQLQPALIDLQSAGPHFTIVGPPLGGKTTALYNWVFSLAYRYPPSEVALVLVDMQRRFVDYGGIHTLRQLPHVLAAVSEVEELRQVADNLQKEGEVLRAQQKHELFVLIDNYDDLAEEIERERDLARDLAAMARSYGKDGIHFVIAGTLDSGITDLRRRVMASNYGVGLVDERSVGTLRVTRTPTALRNNQLNVGRGFLVRSGQPMMIQLASPYDGMGVPLRGDDLEEIEARNREALDRWVVQICERFGDQKAHWSAAETVALGQPQTVPRQQSPHMQRMVGLLQKCMKREIERLDGNGDGNGLVTARFIQMEILPQSDEGSLLALLKDVWRNEKRALGMDDSFIAIMLDSLDDESLLLEIEGLFSE